GRSEEQIALRIKDEGYDTRPAGDGHVAHYALHRIVAGAVWSRARGPRKCGVRSVYERKFYNLRVIGESDVEVVLAVDCDAIRIADRTQHRRRCASRRKHHHTV